jgi:hypothetical protein
LCLDYHLIVFISYYIHTTGMPHLKIEMSVF